MQPYADRRLVDSAETPGKDRNDEEARIGLPDRGADEGVVRGEEEAGSHRGDPAQAGTGSSEEGRASVNTMLRDAAAPYSSIAYLIGL